MNKFIVGAYATAPSLGGGSKSDERDFYRGLTESCPTIRGLEIPFWGESLHQFGSDFLYEMMFEDWESVITCIPGTMSALSNDKYFGLASDDEEGRLRAVAMHKRASELVRECNEYFGRHAIIAVQIATAPSVPVEGVSSSTAALERSLEEMLEFDWQEARLVIEHCDTTVNGRSFEKGFMSLCDEIGLLREIESRYQTGITINWARSAIEGRNSETPVKHLTMLQENKMLSGLMFSGTSTNDIVYGQWKDLHMPFAQIYGVEHYENKSLLTELNLLNTLNAIDLGKLDYIGIKLLAMPINNTSYSRRIGINRDALYVLDRMLNEV